MARTVALVLCLLVVLSLGRIAAGQTAVKYYTINYTFERQDKGFRVYLHAGNMSIGTVVLSISDYEGHPYDITVIYELNPYRLGQIVGEATEFRVIVEYAAIRQSGASDQGSLIYKEFSGQLSLSNLVEAEILEKISIERLTFIIIVYGDKGTVFGILDLADLSRRLGLDLAYTLGLKWYAPSSQVELIDPGWMNIKLYSAGGAPFAVLRVTAAPFFNTTRSIRVVYDIINRKIAELVDISVQTKILVPGSKVVYYSTILLPGEDIVIPGDVPQLGAYSRVEITELVINASIPGYSHIVNVTNITGPILVTPPPRISPIRLSGEILEIKKLGAGWVRILVGIKSHLAPSNLKIDYIPEGNIRKPIVAGSLTDHGFRGYGTVLNILLAFRDPGNVSGILKIEYTSRNAPSKVALFNVSLILDESAKVSDKVLNLDYEVSETKDRWILELDRVQRLLRLGMVKPEDRTYYEIKALELERLIERYGQPGHPREFLVTFKIEDSLPLTSIVNVSLTLNVVPDDPLKPVGISLLRGSYTLDYALTGSLGETSYYLPNTTNGGVIEELVPREGANITLNLIIGLPVAECNADLSYKAGYMDTFTLHITNVVAVKVVNVSDSRVIVLNPPRDSVNSCITGETGTESAGEALWSTILEFLQLLIPSILLVLGVLLLVALSMARIRSQNETPN